MNDLKFSKYSPKISNCSYNNIKSFSENRERDVMLASGSTAKFIVTLKVFMTSIPIEVSRRNAKLEKERNKLRHHDVISMVCKLVCTLMENSSRLIIVREFYLW